MDSYKNIRIDNDKFFMHVEGKKYLTLDNGGHPFLVKIDKGKVKIYRQENFREDTDGEGIMDYNLILEYKPERILAGKSILNSMTEFSGANDDPKFDGNSILLDMGDNQYIHIGSEIFSFKSYSKILKLYSPVGNSQVPYPFGIDVEGNFYILLSADDFVILSPTAGLMINLIEFEDPYSYWWSNSKSVPTKKVLDLKRIQKRLY